MALTQQQQDLIDCLKMAGLEKDDISAIMLPLANSPEQMDEMLDYLIDALQSNKKITPDEAMEKMYRIAGMF
ncbi:MAG: hypothetical protein IKS53_06070 [Bacteroidales bacterium]|nr:hypothetical protein [Bacteroidales bacterium]